MVVDAFRYPRHPQAPQVVNRLLGTDATLATEANAEIKALGTGAMPELRDRMRTAQGDTRIQIIKTAAELRNPPELLLEILQLGSTDPNPKVRHAVAVYASPVKDIEPQLLPVLQPLMRDESADVRATALLTLSSFSVPDAIPARELVARTQDTDIRVAATACALAATSKDPVVKGSATQSLPRLIAALNEPQPATRATVLYALGQYGTAASAAARAVSKLLKAEKVPEVKLQAALTLIRINSPQGLKQALPVLQQFSKSETPALRDTASAALRAYSPPRGTTKPRLK